MPYLFGEQDSVHVDHRVPTTSKNTAFGVDAVELGSIPAAGSLDVVDVLDRVKRSELDALLLNLWQLSLHHHIRSAESRVARKETRRFHPIPICGWAPPSKRAFTRNETLLLRLLSPRAFQRYPGGDLTLRRTHNQHCSGRACWS